PSSSKSTALSFQEGADCDASKQSQPRRSVNAIELITRNIDRDTPATPGLWKDFSKGHSPRKRSLKRTNYYAEVFSVRKGPAIPKAAGVCVELKTNVILENEFEFARSLSQMIAKRYHQSEDSISVSLDHSACMVMGGTFEGTYVLTITSVALISPTVNKRNTVLITDWLKKNLGVSGHRGVVRFMEVGFANYATCGETMLSLMEKKEASKAGTASGLIREVSMKRSISQHQSKR
ncbi:Tautomerase/MIF superfamily, partial [Trichophaea hybrida]